MIKIYNDSIFVSSDEQIYVPLIMNLTVSNKITYRQGNRLMFKQVPEKIFVEKDNGVYIPRGLYQLISTYFEKSEVIDEQNKDISNIFSLEDFNNLENILNGIQLRDYQILAVRKMCMLQRCIIQCSTGAGKTEMIAAFLKLINLKLGYTPTTLVIEPTVQLVDSTVSRFKKYGIDVYSYRNKRAIEENKVIVTHPKSLCNDIDKDDSLLSRVKIMVADETHHLKSVTWRKPLGSMPSLEYSIGVSATAIDQKHTTANNISMYTPEELYIIGSTGILAMNMKAGTLIDKSTLAVPVVMRLDNPADEQISNTLSNDWHEIVNNKLMSVTRNNIIAECALFFTDKQRKTLILVNTVEWSRLLLKSLSDYGLGNITRASYGGGKFEGYNEGGYFSDNSQVMSKFSDGDFNILIGTTHLYEGVDVPNLDVVILAFGGKKDRMQLQGIGRALRKTKSGKYAYIIDFTDHCDKVLSKQSSVRLNRYKNDLKIPDSRIFNEVKVKDLPEIFKKLEE